MKRNIDQQLREWKQSEKRKPLIVNGARRVGKSHVLKHFGEMSYQNVAYLNFEKDQKLAQYFEGALDPKQLIQTLSIHTDIEIKPEETLLIFDEIQECPKALVSLKCFCEEANTYHVVAAGSFLWAKSGREKSFPFGKVSFLHLYPLTFFEFLSALGHEKIRIFLEEHPTFAPLPGPLHEQLLEWLKAYLFVGGMPEAVAEYVKTCNFNKVREVQQGILSAYERDFVRHAPPREIRKIMTVWQQLPDQLAKGNKKFLFAPIGKHARAREYEGAIEWLLHAGLVHATHLVESPQFPLSAHADNNTFKIFLVDVGLLGAQSSLSPQAVIEGDRLFTEFKGSLTASYIAQELVASREKELYYWMSEGIAKMDFLLEEAREIYPLEVKVGPSQKKKSLLAYKKKYAPQKLIRTGTMNLKSEAEVHDYPLYLLSRFPHSGPS